MADLGLSEQQIAALRQAPEPLTGLTRTLRGYYCAYRKDRDKKGEGYGGKSGVITVYGYGQRILDRLLHYRGVLRVRARHRGRTQDEDADLRGLLPLREVSAELDHGPRLPWCEPGGAGDHGDGCRGGDVRDHAVPLLLDRRDPGDVLRGSVHDPLLLRQSRPLRPWLPEAPLQRGDARVQLHPVRHLHDPALRHKHVRDGARLPAAPRLVAHGEHLTLGGNSTRVRDLGRPLLIDLQRGLAVLPDHVRSGAARGLRPYRRWRPLRLEGVHRRSAVLPRLGQHRLHGQPF